MAIVLVIAGVSGAVLWLAPGFLLYATNYEKADVIVLLLGPDFTARQKHAHDLLRKGMAERLIIPAYKKTYWMEGATIKGVSDKALTLHEEKPVKTVKPFYFEDTHIELLAAKKAMKQNTQISAIFVSSPYHMRRIQLMVKKEFGGQDYFYFAPTPYEPAPRLFWKLSLSDWKKVYREYIKIAWFMVYTLWSK